MATILAEINVGARTVKRKAAELTRRPRPDFFLSISQTLSVVVDCLDELYKSATLGIEIVVCQFQLGD